MEAGDREYPGASSGEKKMTQYSKRGITVKIDLQRPEAQILYTVDGWEWDESPYQTASLPVEHRNERAEWDLLSQWLRVQ